MLYIYTRQNRAHICKLSHTFTPFQMLCVPHHCQLQPLYCCSIVFTSRGGQELRWLMRPLSSEAVINTVNRSRFSGLHAVTRSSCFSDRNIWGFFYVRAAVGYMLDIYIFFSFPAKGTYGQWHKQGVRMIKTPHDEWLCYADWEYSERQIHSFCIRGSGHTEIHLF